MHVAVHMDEDQAFILKAGTLQECLPFSIKNNTMVLSQEALDKLFVDKKDYLEIFNDTHAHDFEFAY